MTLHVVGARFDEHRNTSRVWPVDPRLHDEALRESARLRKRAPRFVKWLQAGAPAIRSDDEHRKWFGCAYRRGELT
jgi:hypothetical protein